MKEDSWDPALSLEKCKDQAEFFKKIDSNFTDEQLTKFSESVKKLDKDFIMEKALIIRDTILEIQRNRKTTRNTLLQRNVWSSLDAIALHFDYSGFTPVFQDIATTLLKKDVRFDNPELLAIEWQLFLDFLGIDENEAKELDLPFSELKTVMEYAEKQKSGVCGLPNISSPEFSFKKAFSKDCARPDQILEHHSPQSKAVIALIIGVINIISLFGFPIGTVITVVMLLIVGCAGC